VEDPARTLDPGEEGERVPEIGVIFGGPSPEHDVSVLLGLPAGRALVNAGHAVRLVYWSLTGDFFEVPTGVEPADFVSGPPSAAAPLTLRAEPGGGFLRREGRLGRMRPLELEALVVCCHGSPGEDGTLQGALDLAGVPYTGPGLAGAALGMDKLAFAGLVERAGLPHLPRVPAEVAPPFPPPYIVKPRFGGSSIGVEVAEDAETVAALVDRSPHLRRGAVVEPWRSDLFDVNVAVRTFPSLELSAIERPLRPSGGQILSYGDKYMTGGEGMASAPRELPADLPAPVADAIRTAARDLVSWALLRGVARVDFLVGADGEVYVNEVNTIPGSLARYLWIDPPISFTRLLEDLVAEAKATPARRWVTAGADGRALRASGSVASKLG